MNHSFRQGFEKSAAWYHRAGNKIKGMFTGKEYLYHGTSTAGAKGIEREGINPATYSDLSYTSRDPDVARAYAYEAGNPGGDASIVRFGIPKKDFKTMGAQPNPGIARREKNIAVAREKSQQQIQGKIPSIVPFKSHIANLYARMTTKFPKPSITHTHDVVIPGRISPNYVEKITQVKVPSLPPGGIYEYK